MKLQFEAIIVEVKSKVNLTNSQTYKDIVCRVDDTQYYVVRCKPKFFDQLKNIATGATYIIEAETRTQNVLNHGETKYNILLIATKITEHGLFNELQTKQVTQRRGKDLELAIPWSSSHIKT